MIKIAILTFHRALNYGAVLQAYALNKVLSEIDAENIQAEILDYRCEVIESSRSVRDRLKGISAKKVLSAGLLLYKRGFFDRFIKKHLKMSGIRYNRRNVSSSDDIYSAFVVGSDQVWNYRLNGSDSTFFLDFVADHKKKFSYAASMGLTSLDEDCQNQYTRALSTFSEISVRENSMLEYWKGRLPVDVQLSLDPTLLLTGREWAELSSHRHKNKPYILAYNVPKPDKLFAVAKELAERTRLEIIYITNNARPQNAWGSLAYPTVEGFIDLLENASYVVTNSFHGTVFSILFHRPMLVELKKGSSANDRIQTLLGKCGLLNRIYDGQHMEEIFHDIDWEQVEQSLAEERKLSMKFLTEVCDTVKG